ncbi:MAG TPA: cupin domain-containing protein [Bacteroidetes bacterium]|nr:cupin domain-containing protein [Bacteroidota bacterium]
MKKVNIAEKLSLFKEYWRPRIVGELNDQYVKVAKVKGEFIRHKHDKEDELFLILKGSLEIKLRKQNVILNEGEFFIVPRGVEHKTVAKEETHILLFEPKTTLITGSTTSEVI